MERGIVTIEVIEGHRKLLREAGEYASGIDAELGLIALIPESDFEKDVEKDVETMESLRSKASSTGNRLSSRRHKPRWRTSPMKYSPGLDVRVTPVATVVREANQAEALIRLGAEHDCDHAFIVGKAVHQLGRHCSATTPNRSCSISPDT